MANLHKATTKWMEKHYNHYNDLYFDGMLGQCNFSTDTLKKNALGVYDRKTNTITLNKNMKYTKKCMKNTLIHEMCHYAQRNVDKSTRRTHHGTDFKKWANYVATKSKGKYIITTYHQSNDDFEYCKPNK